MPATPAEMFERHHLAIYRYLLMMTGSRETAEELTQDVFLRAIQKAGAYEERSHERAWLFRIARNLRIDGVRRARRAPAVSSIEDDEPSQSAQQALRLGIRQALAMVPDEEREAFVVAEVVGLSYAEIAETCGATSAAIRSRIYRARMQLRTALNAPAVHKRVV